jgi:hypothetical protein
MPDIHTRLGRYCLVHRYTYEAEYLVCDFCHEHRFSVYVHDAVEYYKTARIADKNGHYMRKYIDYMTLRTSHDQAHHRQLLDLIV